MLKNNKGITLTSLVVTVIVLLILASVGITSGKSTYKYIKFNNAKAQFQTMQSHVNAWYERLKTNSDILNYGRDVDEADTTKLTKMGTDLSISDFSEYKYFSSEYIKNDLDIDGISNDFLINISDRTILLFGGIEYQGETYYTAEKFGINNVEYKEVTGEITFERTVKDNNIIIYNIKFPNDINISKYNVQYQKPEEDVYTTLTSDKKTTYTDTDGNVYNDAWSIECTVSGTYKLRITTASENLKSDDISVEVTI